MTEQNKPSIRGNETPAELLQLRLKLAEAERTAAAEKRRADELDSRLKSKPAQAAQQQAIREKTNWNFNFSIKRALWLTTVFGAAGLTAYSASSLFSPAKKLFMMGPSFVKNRLGTASAIALMAAQVLGVGAVGLGSYDYAMEKTALSSTNKTMTARFGLAGLAANQFIKSSADMQDPHRRQPFFDVLTNNSMSGAAEVTLAARDQLARLDENRGPVASREALMRHRYVQICTPQITDADNKFLPEAQTAMNNGEMERHFSAVNDIVNGMKTDPGSRLNAIFKKEGDHAQLMVSPYTQAQKEVRVMELPASSLRCPDTHLQVTYDAQAWLDKANIRPKGLDPK